MSTASVLSIALRRPLARITVEEIAERLALGERAVYAFLEHKEIPAIRLGRRWIISRYAYEQWEKSFGQRTAA